MYFKNNNNYKISITIMKKNCIFSLLIFIMLLIAPGAAAINIVSTTTVLSDPLDYIGGDNVEVISIADPAICPHMQSDIVPNRIQLEMDFIKNADMFVAHNGSVDKDYTMPYIDEFMKSNDFGEANWVTLKDSSMIWNTPSSAKNLTIEVAGWLIEKDPENKTYYEERRDEYIGLIDAADMTPEEKELISGQNAVVMVWQKEAVVDWLGLNLVSIYAPEFYENGQYTSRAIVNDVYMNPEKFRNADYVIENMQSGEIAKGLEEALRDNGIKVKRIVFTNFPGSLPGIDTLPDVIKYNKNLVLPEELSLEITDTQSSPVSSLTLIGGIIGALCLFITIRRK